MVKTRDLLLKIAQENSIPQSKILEIVQKLEEEWYTDAEHLREITEAQWKILGVPARLFGLIKKYLNDDPMFADKIRESTIAKLITTLGPGSPDLKSCISVLQQIICNLISYQDPKYQTLKLTNTKFNQAIGRHADAIEYLKLIGFAQRGQDLQMTNNNEEFLMKNLDEINEIADNLGMPPRMPAEKFNPFKASISSTNFQTPKIESRENDPNKFTAEIEQINKQREEVVKKIRVDRNRKVQRIERNARIGVVEEANFQEDDEIIRKNIQSIIVQRENSMSFQNKRKMELEKLRSKEFIAVVVVRIRFPDDFVLEGSFSINENVGDLYRFVEENLEVRGKFELFSIPPKVVLKNMQEQLKNYSPAVVFNFLWCENPSPEVFLKRSLLCY